MLNKVSIKLKINIDKGITLRGFASRLILQLLRHYKKDKGLNI